MEHIDNINSGLSKYMKALETTGYYPESGWKRLLVYLFLVDVVLEGPLSQFLDDADLPAINRILRCVGQERCLIQWLPSSGRIGKPRSYYLSSYFRRTEDDVPRITQDGELRRTETKD